MTRRSILEVHETSDSFIYKRIMEVAIFLDLFLISLNFQFWTYFIFDSTMEAQANKLEWLLYTCVAPFILAKLVLRFWPYAKPKLQTERVFAVLDVQCFIFLLFVLFQRANCPGISH